MKENDHRLSDLLFEAVTELPGDYKPWGDIDRDDPHIPGAGADCSGGCQHYLVLADVDGEHLSYDWGVCINPKSHRYGLLTFEHQGCPACEYDEEEADRIEAEFERLKAEYLAKKRGGE